MKRLFAFVLSLLMLAGVFADAVAVNNDDLESKILMDRDVVAIMPPVGGG